MTDITRRTAILATTAAPMALTAAQAAQVTAPAATALPPLARAFFEASEAFDSRPDGMSEADSQAAFNGLSRKETEWFRSPPTSADDLMLKVWSLIDYFENEGTCGGLLAAQVSAFVENHPDRDLIDPPANRERRERRKATT